MERYIRQTAMKQIGLKGQGILKNSQVTVIGAGGLGSPVLLYLAAAGVGHIRIIEKDHVSLSNLNRQILYEETDISQAKATAAVRTLRQRNSELTLEGYPQELTEDNVHELLHSSDAIILCVDNLTTRQLTNKYCVQHKIPLVDGGISRWYGYVTVVTEDSPCLECMGLCCGKEETEIPVLGAIAGVVGSLQAAECIKLLIKSGSHIKGRILYYDGLAGEFEEVPACISSECRLREYHSENR